MPIAFDDPRFLWLLPAIVPLLWLGVRRLRFVDRWRRRAALMLRAIVLTLLVLILAGPQVVRVQSDLTVIAVLDRSASVRQFAKLPSTLPQPSSATHNGPTPDQWLDAQLRHAAAPGFVSDLDGKQAQRRPDDRYGLIAFDRKASVLALPAHGLPPESSLVQTPTEGTDPAGAIRLALALFPADTAKRMVLAWDGNATIADADILAAARQAAAAGIPIDVIPIQYRARRQVVVESVDAPSQARTGQTVALRVVLRAASPSAGSLLVRRNGTTIDLAPSAEGLGQPITQADWLSATTAAALQPPALPGGTTTPIAIPPTLSGGGGGGGFLCVRRIEIPMHDRGPNRFEVLFEPADPTGLVTTNLRAEGFSFVHGRGKLLLVGDGSSTSAAHVQDQPVEPLGNPLLDALRARGLEVVMLPAEGFPASPAELQPFDAVILHNVPMEDLSPSQQQLLVRYVSDLGGGLIVVGGPDSFGAGGWSGSPVGPILPVSCEIPAYSVLPSGALVLVIDRSGSMAGGVAGTMYTQQQLANEAAVLAVRTLFPGDIVGVVAFDVSPKWIAPLASNARAESTMRLIRSIEPGGGTDIFPALDEAVSALEPIKTTQAAARHIVLLTDGQSQEHDYSPLLARMRRAGITLSTVGVGDARNSPLLETLAKASKGTYYPVDDPRKLPQVFIKEARTVRRNLIKEVVFTPTLRGSYSPITAGMDRFPTLRGLVMTSPRRDPRVVMPWAGPEGEPLFAHWQVGLGRVAAFTSDATSRWAANWLPWDGYGDFWARTARAIARPSASRAMDLLTTLDGDQLHLRLDLATDTPAVSAPGSAGGYAESANSPRATVLATVLSPEGESIPVTLTPTAPGIYEATLPAASPGSYLATVLASPDTRDLAAAGRDTTLPESQITFGGVTRPASPELRDFASHPGNVTQIAQLTGGRILDWWDQPPASPEALPSLFLRDNVQQTRAIRPIWRPWMAWLLVLLLLDVANRRIAWDPMWLLAMPRALWQAVTRTPMPAPASEVTLAQLKRRAAERDESRVNETTPVVSPAPKAQGLPSLELNDNPTSQPQSKLPTQPEPAIDESTPAGRLLAAKRRARQRLDPP